MRHTLEKLREPFAFTVIGLAVIRIAIMLVYVVKAVMGGAQVGWDGLALLPLILPQAGLFALLAAVLACIALGPTTRHARGITIAAAVLASLPVVASWLWVAQGLGRGDTSSIQELFVLGLSLFGELGVQTLAAICLWVLAFGREPKPAADEGSVNRPEVEDEPAPASAEVEAEPEPVGVQPVWKVEEAVGAQWSRAGDAATGAEAVVTGNEASDRWAATGREVTGVNWAAIEGRKLSASDADNDEGDSFTV